MAKWINFSLFVFLYLNFVSIVSSELLTLGAIGAGLGALGYNRKFVVDQTYCRVSECCNDKWIVKNFKKLSEDLSRHVFGQPIVVKQVVQALRVHYEHIDTSKKPLVMTFHGTPGTGKNYVADFITKSVYFEGLNSGYVHRFAGRLDFPVAEHAQKYSVEIRDKIIAAIRKCPQSMFIFDEVDAMPSGVFDTITSLLDHHVHIDHLNFRQAVFIFLVNAGGVEITEKLYDLYKNKQMKREDFDLYHFESLLEASAYNLKGGLMKSRPIETGLIDHYVPFLPLEKQHVIDCIAVEFQRLGIQMTEANKKGMLEYVDFEKGLFATNGCKRISKKAEIFVDSNN